MSSNLMKRCLSAALLIPPVLGLIWMGEWLFNGAIAVLLFVALHEWYGLTAPNLTGRGRFFAYGVPVVLMIVAMLKGLPFSLGLAALSAPLMFYYAHKQHLTFKPAWKGRAFWAAMGLPYIVASAFALIYLRGDESQGLVFIAYLLAVVWGTDTGAYIAGRTIGGAKLLPRISPKKTWAGLFGGMVSAGLLGYFVIDGFGSDISPIYAGLLGMFLAVVAQAGDFLESYAKRRADVKDSGNLIPGHGGLLDRVDGLFPVALVLGALALLVESGAL